MNYRQCQLTWQSVIAHIIQRKAILILTASVAIDPRDGLNVNSHVKAAIHLAVLSSRPIVRTPIHHRPFSFSSSKLYMLGYTARHEWTNCPKTHGCELNLWLVDRVSQLRETFIDAACVLLCVATSSFHPRGQSVTVHADLQSRAVNVERATSTSPQRRTHCRVISSPAEDWTIR